MLKDESDLKLDKLSNDELRRILITLDGKGRIVKEKVLDILLKRGDNERAT